MTTPSETRLAAENIELRHAVRLLMAGWTVEKTHLIGGQAWCWTSPDEQEEATCLGDWNEPPTVPEILK